ncbi:MAG: hypothetical protein ACXVFN_01215 [Solirubrobacteraceae bacterium]
MTSTSGTPADRAAAVLRAATAAAAAGHPAEPAPVAPAVARPPVEPGAAERLLRAADELASGVEAARGRLDDLHRAIARLAG